MLDFLIIPLGFIVLGEIVYWIARYFRFMPIVRVKELEGNGTNNLLFATMNTSTPDWQSRKGILYQELREWFSRGGVICRLIAMISPIVVGILKRFMKITDRFNTIPELKGKAVEIAIAVQEGHDKAQYEMGEARSLITYYKAFKGMTLAKVIEDLRLYENDAKMWIDQNHRYLEKKYEKLRILDGK